MDPERVPEIRERYVPSGARNSQREPRLPSAAIAGGLSDEAEDKDRREGNHSRGKAKAKNVADVVTRYPLPGANLVENDGRFAVRVCSQSVFVSSRWRRRSDRRFIERHAASTFPLRCSKITRSKRLGSQGVRAGASASSILHGLLENSAAT